MIAEASRGRCWITAVECFEHGANGAVFENPEGLLRQVSAEALASLVNAVT